MRRRIAIILERADVALGGAERSMFEVASALAELDCQVDLLAAKGQRTAENVRILCPDTPGRRMSLPTFAAALKQHLSQTGYDIVHSVLPFDFADVYQPRGGTYAETLIRNAASYRHLGCRWYKRATALANRRRARLLQAERQLCRGPNGPVIAALSRYVAEQLKRHYGTDVRRIRLILNGVVTDRSIAPSSTARLRSQILGLLHQTEADRPLLLLFAAHNFRLKGLEPLIRALSLARQRSPKRPPCLIVLGGGTIAPYRRLTRRLNVEPHVLFLGPAHDVGEALTVTDVGVLPTFYDPSSRFILEALAAGKPVITTRFNGATDLFTDGRHGKVIDSPHNVPALAAAITHFTNTAHLDRAAEAIGEDDLRANLSIHRVARDLVCLYEQIGGSVREP